jgi:hypothetical protein
MTMTTAARMATAAFAAAVLATSCSSGSAAHVTQTQSTTTFGTPSPSPTLPALSMPRGAIPRALVGTYVYESEGTRWVTLRANGTYAQWNPYGELDIVGRYGVRGRTAIFMDEETNDTTGRACDGLGAYAWHFAGTRLVMTKTQDECTVGRIEQWTAGWKKVSGATLPTAPTLRAARHR